MATHVIIYIYNRNFAAATQMAKDAIKDNY